MINSLWESTSKDQKVHVFCDTGLEQLKILPSLRNKPSLSLIVKRTIYLSVNLKKTVSLLSPSNNVLLLILKLLLFPAATKSEIRTCYQCHNKLLYTGVMGEEDTVNMIRQYL